MLYVTVDPGTALLCGGPILSGIKSKNGQGGPIHMMKMKNNNYRVNPELERARILIEEKRLEVRKELLNEKPDWNKIEKCVLKVALSK